MNGTDETRSRSQRVSERGNALRWQKRKPIRHWDDSKFRRTKQRKRTQCACVCSLHAFEPGALISFCQWWQIAVVVVNSFFLHHSEISFFSYFCWFLNECKTHRYFEWDSSSLFRSFVRSFFLPFNSRERQILSNHKKIPNRLHIKSIYWMLSVYSDMSTPNRWIDDDARLCVLFVERKYWSKITIHEWLRWGFLCAYECVFDSAAEVSIRLLRCLILSRWTYLAFRCAMPCHAMLYVLSYFLFPHFILFGCFAVIVSLDHIL